MRILGSLLIVFFISAKASAQSCTGSLGDPIVNITFGAGPNFGPSLPAGVTNLAYLSNTCPNDGQYSIVNYSSGCFNNWHTVSDHTGDANGYFMLINASYDPSDFYVQPVNGLCSGTTYEFSAWVINVVSGVNGTGIYPNITFSIEKTDGTVLQSYNSGYIVETRPAQWTRHGFFFTTPAGVTSVVLRMKNNAPGGFGNDLAIDDIAFRPAGPATKVNAIGFMADSITTCAASLQFTSTVETCYASNSYQWQESVNNGAWIDIPGATTATLVTPTVIPGIYKYRLLAAPAGNIQISNCRVASNVITVLVRDKPRQENVNFYICPGQTYLLPNGSRVPVGVYRDTLQFADRCDSVVRTFNVNNISPEARDTIVNICAGTVYPLPWGPVVNSAGIYRHTIRASGGCDSVLLSVDVRVDIVPPITLYKSNDISCMLGTAKLQATGGSNFAWSPVESLTSSTTANTIAFPTTTTTYTVQVTSPDGCTGRDSITVFVNAADSTGFVVPSAFSPNNDGLNDCFGLRHWGAVTDFHLNVYNRWGQKIFESREPSECWNGTIGGMPAKSDVFVYYVTANTFCGPVARKGTLTLIR